MTKVSPQTIEILNRKLSSVKKEVTKVEFLLKKAAKGILTEDDLDTLLLKESIAQENGEDWVRLEDFEKTLT